jgi:hypothetical protein
LNLLPSRFSGDTLRLQPDIHGRSVVGVLFGRNLPPAWN